MKQKVVSIVKLMRAPAFQRSLTIAAPIVALLYLGIGLLAYARIFPGSTSFFVASSFSGVCMRAFSLGLVVLLSLTVVISFRPRIQWHWLIAFGTLMTCTFFMVIVSPHSYTTLYYSQIYGYGELFVTSVSNRSLFFSSLSAFADFVFGLCLLVVLPKAFMAPKQFLLVFLPFIAFMVFNCFYAIIVQKDYFVGLFSGVSPYYLDPLMALFSSKQEFGVFLCPAFCLCPICAWLLHKTSINKPIRWVAYCLLFLSAILLFVIGVFSLCKTAILGNLFMLLFFSAGLVLHLYKNQKRLLASLLTTLFAAFLLAVILFLAIPAFHETGFSSQLYDIVVNQILNRLDVGSFSRINILVAYFNSVPMQNIFFGFGKGLSDIYVRSLAPILKYGIHTGAVNYLANYGIISFFLVVVILVLYLFKRAMKMWESPMITCVILGVFVAALVLNMAELEILLFSSSATVFIFNFVIFVFAESVIVNPTNKGGGIICQETNNEK